MTPYIIRFAAIACISTGIALFIQAWTETGNVAYLAAAIFAFIVNQELSK